MKKFLSCLLALLMTASLLAGCGQQKTDDDNGGDVTEPALADGVYTADFNTDSSMFHANETCDGKGVLTVKDGQMTIHVSLASTSIVNLFPGLKEDAQKDGAVLLQPTKDTVTYPDGLSEEVNGFDIPVPALDTEFDVALIGKKGVWYDHKVSVSNPVLKEDDGDDAAAIALADGTYTIEVGGWPALRCPHHRGRLHLRDPRAGAGYPADSDRRHHRHEHPPRDRVHPDL